MTLGFVAQGIELIGKAVDFDDRHGVACWLSIARRIV
jgi:hypothetical protein